MKKELYLIEVVNFVTYFNNLSEEKRNAIPFKAYYWLKKAINMLSKDAEEFEQTRDEEITKIRADYFSEEKSEEYDVPQVDDDGNPVLDENGNQVTEPGRKIKAEFEDAYRNELNELNQKLNDVLMEKMEYEIKGIDVGELVNSLPDDSPLDSTDIDMIDRLLNDEA